MRICIDCLDPMDKVDGTKIKAKHTLHVIAKLVSNPLPQGARAFSQVGILRSGVAETGSDAIKSDLSRPAMGA